MTKEQFEKVVKRYNALMYELCYEHVTIGTRYSEGTEKWNLADMVYECEYWLSTFYEDGHANGEMRYGDADERKEWRRLTGKLERFINRYTGVIDAEEIEPTEEH